MSDETARWSQQDLGPPDAQSQYPTIEGPARRLMEHGKDAAALDAFAATASGLGVPGLMAATALATCAVFELAEVEDRRPATIVALMSRVIPWRDPQGVAVHAILSAWVSRNQHQARGWIDQQVEQGAATSLARAFGERLVFCVESAALLSGMSAEQRTQVFAGRFFGEPADTAIEDAGANVHDRQYPGPQWPDYSDWRWELAPLAPCRRPGCRGSVHWKGIDPSQKMEGQHEAMFCSTECERTFWEIRNDYQGTVNYLASSRVDDPEFWRDKADAWHEQFNLAWWHLSRFKGVRPNATDPESAKWHEHYFAVGRMIARAAEWESASESVLAMFMDAPQAKYRAMRVSEVVKTWRSNAHRWPHVEVRINEMCNAADDAIDLRHWLVHSFVAPSWTGEGAQLQKPVRKEEKWAVRSVKLRQVELLAARFRWLLDALTQILADRDPGGPHTRHASDLGPPPPIDPSSA